MIEFTFKSKDNKTDIHCVSWIPERSPKAVLVVVHGMTEYIERYSDFASTLAKDGFLVTGHDHIGHGRSVTSDKELGFFGQPGGNGYLLSDIDTHVKKIKNEYKGIPIYILGHSMGSFLVRQYICEHSNEIDGAIIMGTGTQPAAILIGGRIIAKILSVFKGWHYRSGLVQTLGFGSYNKRIENAKTGYEWLTKDNKIIEKYKSTKECTFVFTLNGFSEMFRSILLSQKKELAKKIRKDLPMLIVSGEDDPVGGYGKGVEKARKMYESAGVRDIKFKLYKNDRHEILNELDRVIVYNDIMNWIDEKLGVL